MAGELNDLLNQISNLENQIRSVEAELGLASNLLGGDQEGVNSAEVSRILLQSRMGKLKTSNQKNQDIEQKSSLSIKPTTSIQLNRTDILQAVKEEISEAAKAEESIRKAESMQVEKLAPKMQTPVIKPSEEKVTKATKVEVQTNLPANQVKPETAGNSGMKEPKVIQIPSVQYTASDIPSIGLLIKKLSELIDLNSKISDELQEIIATSSKADASKRLSSLINKLAYASIYG